MESWNSTNGFIFYGKQGTLMIQQVLTEPGWLKRMTPRDLAALSPTITHHINPYGRFELEMEKRLPLAA